MGSPATSMRLKPMLWALAALLLYLLILVFPVVRFVSQSVNTQVGMALLLILPWVFTITLFLVGHPLLKALGVLCAAVLGILTPLLLFGMLLAGGFAYDLIQESNWKGSDIRVYRADGGATTSWTTEIRQERTIVPGVVFTRLLASVYRCRSITVKPTELGIQIVDHAQCEGPQVGVEIPLKQYLYF